jgi:hypothetical protein
VLDADFVGAFNLAVRPIVKDGRKNLKMVDAAELHTRINPTVGLECAIPLYRFCGATRDALERVVV